MHFVRQSIGHGWDVEADDVPETEHIAARADGDDADAETFEELAADLEGLAGRLDFSKFTLVRPAESRGGASPSVEGAGEIG